MSRWIHELTWPDVAEYLKRGETALVPVGAVEQHGPVLRKKWIPK